MKNRFLVHIFSVLLFFCIGNTNAQIRIISGVNGGSYYRFANDIKSIVSDVDIEVINSAGSVENLKRLISGSEMNITFLQEDVLVNQQLKDLEQGTDNIENIRILLPLGFEKIHLITRKSAPFKSLKDLTNKKVLMGTPDQGTYITARLVKEMTEMKWTDVNDIPFDSAFNALENKQIDAFFFIGATPVNVFEQLDKDSEVKLIPLTDSRLGEIYTKSVITSGTYTWSKNDIQTYSLKFVLATNILKETKERRELIRNILNNIKTNRDKLISEGHKNWSEVSFDIENTDWRIYKVAEDVFNPVPPLGPNIVLLSGVKGGSYDQFAHDIRHVTKPRDSLAVISSNGSVDNLNQLMLREKTFVTFLQYDVLLQQALQDTEDETHYTDSIRILIPLANEDIHLVTRSDCDINSLKDLKNRKVGIGTIYQGTYVTARLIKEITKVNWIDVPIAFEDVYNALFARTIDAFFFVGASPVSKLFYLTTEEKIKLVPIEHRKLDKVYVKTIVTKGTYKWQPADVKTYAVKSVLATNVTDETKQQSASINEMLNSIKNNKKILLEHGHRKWRDVNYDFTPIDWKSYNGAEDILKLEPIPDNIKELNISDADNYLTLFDRKTATTGEKQWFYLRLLINRRDQSYTIIGTGSRLINGMITDFDEDFKWGIERRQVAIGPFTNLNEGKNARLMYRKNRPRIPDNMVARIGDVYWFYVSLKTQKGVKAFDLSEMPSQIETGSTDDFLDSAYKNMKYGFLAVGPFWNKEDAILAEKIYRSHE